MQIVRIKKGKYAGTLAKLLSYEGLWFYVEFLDKGVRPKYKYFPPEFVELVVDKNKGNKGGGADDCKYRRNLPKSSKTMG